MTAPAVSVTYAANTVLTAGNLNTNFSDLVTYISNRNDGTATWDRCLVTSASAVPLIVNNSTGTSNIANFQDNGSNVFQVVDGGDVYMNATKKLYLDGGSNTYISESGADTISAIAGGSEYFRVGVVTVRCVASDLIIDAAKILYLDGGSNTYIRETSGDVMDFTTGGTLRLRISAAGVITMSNLAGVGSRTVVADANGVLSAP